MLVHHFVTGFSILVASLLFVSQAHSHPGMGIVVDPDGAVTFTDIARQTIWRVSPKGDLSRLIENRWTHTLQRNEDGVIYYEREEPGQGLMPCSLWRIKPDGSHEMIVAPVEDRGAFISGGVFYVDAEENIYFVQHEQVGDGRWFARIRRRSLDGTVMPFTGYGDGELFTDGTPDVATIGTVNAMTPGPDGSFYFTDREHIRRVETQGENAGSVTTIAAGIIDENPVDPPHPTNTGGGSMTNRIFGIGVDADGTVIAAYQAGRRVVRIGGDGRIMVVFRSEPDWSPIGVAAHGSTLYVLEIQDGSSSQLRVTHVNESGEHEIVAAVGTPESSEHD